MPNELPPSLYSFTHRGFGGARLQLDDDGNSHDGLQQAGAKKDNVFARAWDFMTRSPEEVQKNKDVSEAFVKRIELDYGPEVAKMVGRELKDHIAHGRPLTTDRIHKLVGRSEEMKNRIFAANDVVLSRQIDKVIAKSTEGVVGDDSLLTPEERRGLILEAIRLDPLYSSKTFDDDGFVRHFSEVGKQRLERETMTNLMPNTVDLVLKYPEHGKSLVDRIQMPGGGRMPEDNDQMQAFSIALMTLTANAQGIALGNEKSVDSLSRLVAMRMLLEDRPLEDGELPRMRDLQLEGPPKEMQQAVLQDMKHIEEHLSQKTGLPQLSQQQQESVIRAFSLSTNITFDAGEGKLAGVFSENAPQTYEQLREDLEVLRNAQPEGEQAKAMLRDVIKLTEQALGLLGAGQKGMTEQEMRSIGDGPTITDTLQCLGDGGFTKRDLQLLRAKGMDIGQTLGKFTLDEAKALTARLDLDTGLEFKRLGVPINEHTANAYAKGVTLNELKTIHTQGLEEGLKSLGEGGFDHGDLEWLRQQDGMPVGIVLSRFNLDEARALKEHGEGIQLGSQMKAFGVPIDERTLGHGLNDRHVTGEPELLGGGLLSKPYKVSYGLYPMVYKEARAGEGWGPQSGRMGIPKDSLMSVRNVATKVIDDMLDFDLVPETRFGMLNGKLGMVMEFAEGAAPIDKRREDITDSNQGQMLLGTRDNVRNGVEEQETLDMELTAGGCKFEGDRVIRDTKMGVQFDFTDPGLRRELTKLQLLDNLTGQGDRHTSNYIIQLDGGGRFVSVQAIDNDQAFGNKVHPNDLLFVENRNEPLEINGRAFGDPEFRGVTMPPVIDTDMLESIRALDPEEVKQKLDGLVTPKEVEATLLRLHTLKQHVKQLEETGRVIDPDDWGSEQVTQWLQDRNTSYVGRDQDLGNIPFMTYQEKMNG